MKKRRKKERRIKEIRMKKKREIIIKSEIK